MGAFQNWGTLSRRTDSKGSRWMQMVSCIFLNIFEMVSLFQPKGDWNVLRFSDPIYSVGAQNDSLWGLWVSRRINMNQRSSAIFVAPGCPFHRVIPGFMCQARRSLLPIHQRFGKLRNLWRFRVVTSPTWTELVAEASMVSASGVCLGWRLRMLGSPRQQIWGWELWARFLGNQSRNFHQRPQQRSVGVPFLLFDWTTMNQLRLVIAQQDAYENLLDSVGRFIYVCFHLEKLFCGDPETLVRFGSLWCELLWVHCSAWSFTQGSSTASWNLGESHDWAFKSEVMTRPLA